MRPRNSISSTNGPMIAIPRSASAMPAIGESPPGRGVIGRQALLTSGVEDGLERGAHGERRDHGHERQAERARPRRRCDEAERTPDVAGLPRRPQHRRADHDVRQAREQHRGGGVDDVGLARHERGLHGSEHERGDEHDAGDDQQVRARAPATRDRARRAASRARLERSRQRRRGRAASRARARCGRGAAPRDPRRARRRRRSRGRRRRAGTVRPRRRAARARPGTASRRASRHRRQPP